MISVKISGIDELKKKIADKKDNFDQKGQVFLKRLAEAGLTVANAQFRTAQYDGVNDVVVKIDMLDRNRVAVVANGQAVAFIEFGTGIYYPEEHPKAQQMGAVRGSFGQGKGNNESWTYYGEAGTNGAVVRDSDNGTVVRTKGNPPARAMYYASQEMLNKIQQIAKEVFTP